MIILLICLVTAFLLLLSLFCCILHVIIKYKVKWRYRVILLLSVVVILCFGYAKIRYTYIIPFKHLVFQPSDYYDPLIVDEFMFTEKGYRETYLLPYKYPQIHAIKISCGENDWSQINGLTGKLKAEFFHENRLLFEKQSNHVDGYMTDTLLYLIKFPMPLNNKYKSSISVKLTVLEPFKELGEFDKPFFVQVGVIGH